MHAAMTIKLMFQQRLAAERAVGEAAVMRLEGYQSLFIESGVLI
jgi:hypothetical protein